MRTYDYTCLECWEMWESRASMAKDAKYQKLHRASWPFCRSANVTSAAGRGRPDRRITLERVQTGQGASARQALATVD